ncbi:transposase, partial [Burkholderia ubonensis]|uniref:transposase n=1 Tax=Burkholderia ubonensis TaxID=101571 RepID=UPI0039F62066
MDEIPAAKRVKSSKRPNFADEFKRALVEQTFEPGASVSLVSRRNDVNTNLLFRWRDLPPTNRASRSLVKFVFGEEDEHEEALYGTANHRVSEGSRGR